MADDEKDKSTDQILQALDALSHISQARTTRRATSLPLPRSGSGKDGSDAGAVEEAQPRLRRRLSPRSPFWFKPKLDKNGNYDDEEEGDDAALVVVIKSQGLSLMLPFRSRSKLDKKEDDDYEEEDDDDDDDSAHSTATPEADGEKEIMSWGLTRAMSHIGMRRIGCLFTLDVVAAQGLPPSLNGLRVAVTVRRKETRDGAAQTMPARVQLGAADIDEVLYVRCHLYGTGGGATGKPLSFEPRPFLLSLIAINAPELDFDRSTVDLSLFAKEFTDKCVRQWDMVFPLGGKAKGGELVVKLAFQSIDDGGSGSYSQRKLRRSSISNMLTPKITHAKTPKMGVSAPDLRGIDSFMLDDPGPELTPIAEVKETEQKEPECEAAEPTPVAEVMETQQKEPADEPTPVAEVKEEKQQKELELETVELTPVVEVKKKQQKELELEAAELTPVVEVKEQQKELELETDELTPVAEVKEEQQKDLELEAAELTPVAEVKEEQHKEPELETAELTPVAEVKEEQQKEPELEAAELTPVVGVKEEQQKDLELEAADLTPVTEVNEEQQKDLEPDAADLTPVTEMKEDQQEELEPDAAKLTTVAEMKEEEQKELELKEAELTPVTEVKDEQQKELELEAAEITLVAEVKEQHEEVELAAAELTPVAEVEEQHDLADEPTPEAEVKEDEQPKEPERESEDAQEDDDSELQEFNVMDKGIQGQEVMTELKEEVDAKKGSEEEEEEASLVAGDEVAKAVANGLEKKSVLATMPSDVSDAVADAVKHVDAEMARPKEVTGESLQVPEQAGEDKGAAAKPSRPRFKWRTVALLVPIAVMVSKTLGAKR